MKTKAGEQEEKNLTWVSLSLLGVACTIGTGFFLGSGIAITMAGPSALFTYVIAGIATYFVYEALARMTIMDPQQGSFRSYAKKAYGRWAGFSSGWIYWLSEMLIMGSQMTALAIFSRFWFPYIPLWIFATGYALLGILVIILGPKGFDRVENILAVLKLAAILMFIILAIVGLFGLFGGGTTNVNAPTTYTELFPNNLRGFLPALIFGFYGFGGIEIMGLLAVRLKDRNDATKAGKVMLSVLTAIYVTSIGLAVLLVSFTQFKSDESPFVTALNPYNLAFVPHLFNGVFIIAGFSTMVASLFAVIRILVTLAEDNDAPKIFAKRVKEKYAVPAIGLTVAGISVSIVISVIIPGRAYEYITTAAGLMLLYNWFFIIGSFGRLIELTTGDQIKRVIAVLLVLLGIFGTLFHHISRTGFYVSIMFLALIGLITFIMSRFWKKNSQQNGSRSLFTKIKQ